MPLDRSGYDRTRVQQALDGWKRTARERERVKQKIEAGKPLEAEKPERLRKYAERLLKNVGNLPAVHGDRLRRGTQERMIGEAEEYLSVMFIARAAIAMRSVGRIRTFDSFGTGFLVAPGVLMTNNHVLTDPGAASRSLVQFRYEVDLAETEVAPVEFRLDPDRLFATDADLDFTLVAVSPTALDGAPLDDFGHLPLVAAEGKIRVGRPVNIVQHPAGERKQVVFRESTLSALPETLRTMAHYTGDTKPGSSGSPVFSDAWEVVALHHSGVPASNADGDWLDVDGNIWDEVSDPEWKKVKWVANEGIRVSSLVARIRDLAASAGGTAQELLERVLEVGEQAERDGVFTPRIPAPQPSNREARPRSESEPVVSAPSGSVSVQVPLTVTVTVGAAGVAGLGVGALERREPSVADYADREGFDRDFLGVRVEFPTPQNTIAGNVATLSGSPETEVRYDHFSVLMNRARRLAYVSGGNLRIDAPFNAPRRDPWGHDPRLHESLQAGNEFYAANDLDRGHLFRRADGAWGESEAEARRASDDTFHWTNIAPQHFVFNQSDRDPELSLWGLLEDHVMAEAERERQRVNVFNGPVFRDDDPSHRGLQVPRAYWKLLAVVDRAGELRAFGFIVGQEKLIQNLPAEAFGAGRFAIYQVKLRDLESRTGLDFGSLRSADVMETPGAEESFLRGAAMVRITRPADIVRARRQTSPDHHTTRP